MQKQILLIALFSMAILTQSTAQNADYRHTVSATAGLNLFQIVGLIDKIDDPNSTNINLDTKGTASYGLTYDYGINNWFSLGASGSFNKFRFSADQVTIDKSDNTTYTGPVDLKFSRSTFSLRPLFHYGNKGKLDMYSGLRVGINLYKINLKSDEILDPQDVYGRARAGGLSPNFQIIAFGLRGYVAPNFAVGFELAMGAPYYAALQLSYRM
jgi:hypothetical protein